MKLTAITKDNQEQVLMEWQGYWINVSQLLAGTKSKQSDLLEFIQSEEAQQALEGIDFSAYLVKDIFGYDRAPILPNPSKILAVGLNYRDHQSETNLFIKSDFPEIFTKLPNTLNHHNATIYGTDIAHHYDYEGELVIVVGQTVKNADLYQAEKAILGYTIGNDFTARVPQFQTSQWTLGKSMDGFAPVGPFLVTKEDFDFEEAELITRVNGEIRQQEQLRHMIYKPHEIVSYLSNYMTLLPGDLIFTGTPSGVILGQDEDKQSWLSDGDTIDISITGIGTLINTFKLRI